MNTRMEILQNFLYTFAKIISQNDTKMLSDFRQYHHIVTYFQVFALGDKKLNQAQPIP